MGPFQVKTHDFISFGCYFIIAVERNQSLPHQNMDLGNIQYVKLVISKKQKTQEELFIPPPYLPEEIQIDKLAYMKKILNNTKQYML